MHSHDKTLIARLGFSDPDKKSPLHDMACAYLSEEDQARKLANMVAGKIALPEPRFYGRYFEKVASQEEAALNLRSSADIYDATRVAFSAHSEVPITKGRDQYRSVVGFADVVVEFNIEAHNVGWSSGVIEYPSGGTQALPREPLDRWDPVTRGGEILVEVKISPTSVGDLLRQMKLYMSHRAFAAAVLATSYPVSQSDAAILKHEGIRHVRLGDGFKAWCQRPTQEADSVQF